MLVGLLLGLLLTSLSILVAYLRNEYIISSVSDLTNIFLRDLTISIGFGIATAVFEEVLFRGILFRLIEEKMGSDVALIISALFFGLVHLLNENSSLLAGVAISIEAGILLAAAYIYTRNLWFPIAIHFAWNFSVGNLWGTEVSGGAPSTPILISKLEGSEWFTGGIFGIEASVQAMIFG
ncbi:MAG: CPBP family intramembrane metalloprotease [Prevotellaceae bacterium]|nr:CPBP family intramembrane metalloprotease [Prevotellaceae bacterium]